MTAVKLNVYRKLTTSLAPQIFGLELNLMIVGSRLWIEAALDPGFGKN
jgi:hypothetical protein